MRPQTVIVSKSIGQIRKIPIYQWCDVEHDNITLKPELADVLESWKLAWRENALINQFQSGSYWFYQRKIKTPTSEISKDDNPQITSSTTIILFYYNDQRLSISQYSL